MPSGHTPFAVLNRIGNPVIRALLDSPLRGVLSRDLALITVTGRRSGREHTFPVGYSREGAVVTVRVGAPQRKVWWRNLVGGAEVGVRIRGIDRRGFAEVVGDEQSGVTVQIQLDQYYNDFSVPLLK